MDSNVKINLLEHSQAKVDLYGYYLSIYLNIMSRVPSFEKIFIFDLLAGEGIYSNGEKGSPLIAIDIIRKLFTQDDCCTPLEVWFNDLEMSKIEPGISKIDRVRRLIEKEDIPDNVRINYFQQDFKEILSDAIQKIHQSVRSKGLFFIDPYGYKDINPEDLQKILLGKDSEIILFLPISHMYRFAEKSLSDPSAGSFPLRDFLIKLYGRKNIKFGSVYNFINSLREKFKEFFGEEDVYISTFEIERNSSNVYCLFYFTTHIYGLQKMIEAKWALDKNYGIGFKTDSSPMLFSGVELSNYPKKVYDFIQECEPSNYELYKYGLELGFLPKHTNDILKQLILDEVIDRRSLDGKVIRGNYLNHKKDRNIQFVVVDRG